MITPETPFSTQNLLNDLKSRDIFNAKVVSPLIYSGKKNPVNVRISSIESRQDKAVITSINIQQGRAAIDFDVEQRYGLVVVTPTVFTRDEQGQHLDETDIQAGETLNALFQLVEDEFTGLPIQVQTMWMEAKDNPYEAINWTKLMSALSSEMVASINSGNITPEIKQTLTEIINGPAPKLNFTRDLLRNRGYFVNTESIALDKDTETDSYVLTMTFQKGNKAG